MSTARQQQGKLAVRVSLHCVLHVLSASFVYSLSRKISHTGEINASQSTGLKIAHWYSLPFTVHERRSMRVLIIDDERSIRTSTAVAIQAAGHHAETADSGPIAILKLQEDACDLAFLDLRLGD
jgi:PleD family two-component response regulator